MLKFKKVWLIIFVMGVLVNVKQIVFCADIIVDNYTKANLPSPGTPGRLARVTDNVRGLWMDQGNQWFGIGGEVINVREFGATGDGVTNDTTAFQAALDAVPSIGGTVFVPCGEYLLGAVTIKSNTVLLGAGRCSYLNFTVTGSPAVAISINTTSHVRIAHMRIGGSAERMISINGSTFVVIEDNDISGAVVSGAGDPAGIHMSGAPSDIWIMNNRFSGNGLGGAGLGGADIGLNSGGGTGLYINGNQCISTGAAYGIALNNLTYSEISGNTIANMVGNTTNNGMGILLYGTASGLSHHNVVQGNTIQNTDGSGIYAQDTPLSVFGGNVVENTAKTQADGSLLVGAIAVNNGPTTITGNVIRNSGKAGITIQGDRHAVSNNVIEGVNVNRAAILIRGGNESVISGNTINNALGIGTWDSTLLTGLVIDNNTILSPSSSNRGISFPQIRDSLILHNTVIFAGGHGIALDGGTRNIIQGNIVKDAGTYNANVYSGIFLSETTHNLVKDNQSYNSGATGQKYGIEEYGAANNNELTDNNVYNNQTAGIYVVGASTLRARNKLSTGPSQGRATLGTGGTVTVTTAEVLSADNIHLTRVVKSGTIGHLSVGTITSGTSFVINSNTSDRSTIFWQIVH